MSKYSVNSTTKIPDIFTVIIEAIARTKLFFKLFMALADFMILSIASNVKCPSFTNTQSGANLDTNKTGFVRIERCISEEKAGYVKLTGKVEEAEFSGVLTKYVLECHGQELKYLEKNDGRRLYQENEQIDLYNNPQDIMQF